MAVRERGSTAVCASVFLVALAVRLIAARELWQLPLVRTPKLDSAEYLSWARRLAAGDFSWPVVSQHGPGYPLFLAAWLAIGSGSPPFAIAVQAVVGALTATLVALIARDSFGDGAALAAGLVYALYAPAIYVDVALLSEGLLLFLLTLALLLLGRAENLWRGPFRPVSAALKGPPRFVIASAGVALGCAILVRPTAVVVASACAMWLLVQRSRNAAAILVVTCAVVIAPAVAKNWSVSRTLSLQGYGGLNVYIGNSPQQSGRPTFRLGGAWDALNAEPSRAGITDPAAQDRYYLRKTLSEIRRQPIAYLRLLAAKLVWLVQAEEIRDSHSFYFFADRGRSGLDRNRSAESLAQSLSGERTAVLLRRRRRDLERIPRRRIPVPDAARAGACGGRRRGSRLGRRRAADAQHASARDAGSRRGSSDRRQPRLERSAQP